MITHGDTVNCTRSQSKVPPFCPAADSPACACTQWDAEVRDRALGLVEDFGRGLPMPAYKEAYESLLVSDRVEGWREREMEEGRCGGRTFCAYVGICDG